MKGLGASLRKLSMILGNPCLEANEGQSMESALVDFAAQRIVNLEAENHNLKESIPAERLMSRLMGLEDGAQAYSADNFEALEKNLDDLKTQLADMWKHGGPPAILHDVHIQCAGYKCMPHLIYGLSWMQREDGKYLCETCQRNELLAQLAAMQEPVSDTEAEQMKHVSEYDDMGYKMAAEGLIATRIARAKEQP